MFAVLKTGGKQYTVRAGDVLRVEKLDAVAGDKIQFNEILMVGTTIGVPTVAGAAVLVRSGFIGRGRCAVPPRESIVPRLAPPAERRHSDDRPAA